MGTNYYLMTKSKELVSQYFDGEYEIVDSPYMGYRIHLNKCSMGWKTAFQSHRMAYTSVKELRQFLTSHKDEMEIYDEYDEKFSVDRYDQEVLHRDENTTYRVALKWGKDKFFGGYTTVEAEEGYEGPVIHTPIDHMEYAKFEKLRPDYGSHFGDGRFQDHYWNDEEGNNFIIGDFC